MKIKSYQPASKILQEHIAYFYFLETGSPDFTIHFNVFPQLHIPVTIHKHGTFIRSKSNSVVSAKEADPFLTVCNGLLIAPLNATISGKLDRVTIVFKPLGLNHFIGAPHRLQLKPDIQLFPYWKDAAFEKFLPAFFAAKRHSTRLRMLEDFLLGKYASFPERPMLEKAIQSLCDFTRTVRIAEVARKAGVNERKFNRVFKNFLAITPVQFRKIARFRHSLSFLDERKPGKLTEAAYESQFFDQAHFIRDYRKLTGKGPGKFFKSLSSAVGGRVLMEVLKDK